jgi:hypothetical protein
VQEWGLHWLAVAHLVGWTEERGCRHDKASGVSPANSLLNADRHVVSKKTALTEERQARQRDDEGQVVSGGSERSAPRSSSSSSSSSSNAAFDVPQFNALICYRWYLQSDCGETRTMVSALRVTTHAAVSDCLNCHGRGPVPLSCALRSQHPTSLIIGGCSRDRTQTLPTAVRCPLVSSMATSLLRACTCRLHRVHDVTLWRPPARGLAPPPRGCWLARLPGV